MSHIMLLRHVYVFDMYEVCKYYCVSEMVVSMYPAIETQ
jgi:hypothetical protein